MDRIGRRNFFSYAGAAGTLPFFAASGHAQEMDGNSATTAAELPY